MKLFILLVFINGYDAQMGITAEFTTLSNCDKAGIAYINLAYKKHGWLSQHHKRGFICMEK